MEIMLKIFIDEGARWIQRQRDKIPEENRSTSLFKGKVTEKLQDAWFLSSRCKLPCQSQ